MSLSSIEKKEIRKFGLMVFIFFGILCVIGLWRQKALPLYLFGFLSLLGAGFMVGPSALKPAYDGWLKAAHFIGRCITIFFLSLAYYLILTPTAWAKRLFGGHPLPIRPDADASTYWVLRPEPAQPRERFQKRY